MKTFFTKFPTRFCCGSSNETKHKDLSTFQDINFIYKTRISRINKTINNTACTSRICRYTSISNVLFRNMTLNVLTSDVNNNQPETEPLIHSHDHHRKCKCKCSCLPRLFFNCCFLVSWTLFMILFYTFKVKFIYQKIKQTIY